MLTRVHPAELLPAVGTVADFRRLAANATLARYQIDPDCLWQQEDMAEELWGCQENISFSTLAKVAMRTARDVSIKTPAGIGRHIAGVIGR